MGELLFRDPRDYLQFEYELRKARRPAYSLRAFARDLRVSPSSLTDFMKQRVGMSADRIQQIADTLHWSPLRKEHFGDLIAARFQKDKGARQASLTRIKARLREGAAALSLEAFRLISEWYHLVLLELTQLQDHLDPDEAAADLGLTVFQVKKALRRMVKLGLMELGDRGYKPLDVNNHFGDVAPSDSIVAFHSQILDLAEKALHNVPMEERDEQSLVYSVKQNEVAQMNAEIRKAVMNIVNRYAHGTGRDCIQILSLHMFPVWKGK